MKTELKEKEILINNTKKEIKFYLIMTLLTNFLHVFFVTEIMHIEIILFSLFWGCCALLTYYELLIILSEY